MAHCAAAVGGAFRRTARQPRHRGCTGTAYRGLLDGGWGPGYSNWSSNGGNFEPAGLGWCTLLAGAPGAVFRGLIPHSGLTRLRFGSCGFRHRLRAWPLPVDAIGSCIPAPDERRRRRCGAEAPTRARKQVGLAFAKGTATGAVPRVAGSAPFKQSVCAPWTKV